MPCTCLACRTTPWSTYNAGPLTWAASLSLASDPLKVPRLIAQLGCAEPDIARLQEVGTQFSAAWLASVKYRVCVGPLFPGEGGGLVTLLHAGLLNGSQVREHAQEHSLSVRIEPALGAVLAAVNLHLPPALPAVRRRAVIGDVSVFLHTAGASVKTVASYLNKAQGPPRGRLALQGYVPERPAGRVPSPVPAGRPDEPGLASGAPLKSRARLGPRGLGNPVRGG